MNTRKTKKNRYKAKRKAKLSIRQVRSLAARQIRSIAPRIEDCHFSGLCYFVRKNLRYRQAFNILIYDVWPLRHRVYAGSFWLGGSLLGDGSFCGPWIWEPRNRREEPAYTRRTIGLLLAAEFVKDLPLKAFRDAGYNC